MNSPLNDHYHRLLDLNEDWEVADVILDLEGGKVEIELAALTGPVKCPECGVSCPVADHAPERKWRHLDTMQFQTILRARVPRSQCGECGVKTVSVPWAGKHSRFTLMFEAFVIKLLETCGNVDRARRFLGMSWDAVHRVMERAVERGLARRAEEPMRHLGIDEKSFLRGQSYVSILCDLEGSRVLEVTPDRDGEAATGLLESLPAAHRESVEAVAMDMWPAYRNAVAEVLPRAAVVHDKFHVTKHMVDAVDKVRRREHKKLMKAGDERLKGSRQLWLFNAENLTDEASLRFANLRDLHLKTARAWAIKEQLRYFWEYRYAGAARKFFADWYGWAIRSRLEPVRRVARMLKRHLDNLLSYFRHRITNATCEGMNSRIQGIKAAARGFRAFTNYRTRILFHCGKLSMMPTLTH